MLSIPGSLRRALPGQDTCEGAVAVKIIHPEPGEAVASNSQAEGPVTPYQHVGPVQVSPLTQQSQLD